MDNKETQLKLIEIERERRRRRNVEPTAPQESGYGKTAAEVGSGVASGFAGGIPDILSLPTRAAGVVAGLGGMAAGSDSVKNFGFGLATQPSFTEKAQQGINSMTGGYTNPSTAEGRAIQSGSQAVGSILSGGALKKGAEIVATKALDYAPKVAAAAEKIAKSRFAKFTSPGSVAQVTSAGGAGAGAQLASEYAGDNPWMKAAGAVGGVVLGGGVGGITGKATDSLIRGAMRYSTPPSGVGTSLVGQIGTAVDPDIPFAQVSGKVRAAAANELKSIRSKYKRAEELAPQATFNASALGTYRKGLEGLRDASLDPEAKGIFDNALRYIDGLNERQGAVKVGDVARGLRRSFSKLTTDMNGAKKSAGKEGIDLTDSFLNDVVANNRITNIGKGGIRAWQEATRAARGYYTKFSDVDEIASIVARDAKSNRKLLPSQVGQYFRPKAENSNVGNVWDATLDALPAGERAAASDAIRRGIIHKAMVSSLKQEGSGVSIDDSKLLGNLMDLRSDKAAWSKFTPTQRASIDRLRAELSRGSMNPKKIRNAVAGTIFALTGRSVFGIGSAASDAITGPNQSSVDAIIKLLDNPVPLTKESSAGVRRAVIPAAVQQVIPDDRQVQ